MTRVETVLQRAHSTIAAVGEPVRFATWADSKVTPATLIGRVSWQGYLVLVFIDCCGQLRATSELVSRVRQRPVRFWPGRSPSSATRREGRSREGTEELERGGGL